MMAETHTKQHRIVDEEGTLLYLETSQVLVDGDDVRVNRERRVMRCPTCGSRLDEVSVVGLCWQPGCGKQLCTNCGTKAHCCGRTLCEDHRHMAMLNSEQIWVCSEHASDVSERQAFYDANVLFDQRMKEQIQRHEAELRLRDMKLKEFQASFQKVLAFQQQALQAALAKQRLHFERARLRMEQFRAFAPTAHNLLASHRRALALPGRRG